MSNLDLPTKPCHTCRRRRLKCDRTFPKCHKCIQMGQECLGYQGLFLWNKGVASRGKMMGKMFEEIEHKKSKHLRPRTITPTSTYTGKAANMAFSFSSTGLQSLQPTEYTPRLPRASQHRTPQGDFTGFSLNYSLTDPLFQNLDQSSRNYLCYCESSSPVLLVVVFCVKICTGIQVASHVCKDLVIYDIPYCNPFRDLIPLTRGYSILFNVILAISALHLSNALQRSVLTRSSSGPLLHATALNETKCMFMSSISVSSEYKDALISKQSALRLLRQALEDTPSVDMDIILASVLLFIEFELIDSGKDDWRLHVNGARRLIDSLPSSSDVDLSNMNAMRSCWVSNCLVYVCL